MDDLVRARVHRLSADCQAMLAVTSIAARPLPSRSPRTRPASSGPRRGERAVERAARDAAPGERTYDPPPGARLRPQRGRRGARHRDQGELARGDRTRVRGGAGARAARLARRRRALARRGPSRECGPSRGRRRAPGRGGARVPPRGRALSDRVDVRPVDAAGQRELLGRQANASCAPASSTRRRRSTVTPPPVAG